MGKAKRKTVDDENGDGEVVEENGTDVTMEEEGDYQKTFVVLGDHGDAGKERAKTIRHVADWVAAGVQFAAELDDASKLAALSSLEDSLPAELMTRCAEHLNRWFPVQTAVLPSLLRSRWWGIRERDVAISAPTGAGKTLCYVLPLLTEVARWSGRRPYPHSALGVVVVPTKGLVEQVYREFVKYNAVQANVVQLTDDAVPEKPDIVVATAERLLRAVLDSTRPLGVKTLRWMVIDEADRFPSTAYQDWLHVVELVAAGSDGPARTLNAIERTSATALRKIVLSATLANDVATIDTWRLHRPRLYRATATEATERTDEGGGEPAAASAVLSSTVAHTVVLAPQRLHPLAVHRLLDEHADRWQKVLVFVNQRMLAARLCALLQKLTSQAGKAEETYKVEQLTADLYGTRRSKLLKKFKTGTVRVLIASDVLARGVDVEELDAVINYDTPESVTGFVHRAGRTGRAGRKGDVVTLMDPDKSKTFLRLVEQHGLKEHERRTLDEAQVGDSAMETYRAAMAAVKTELEQSGEKLVRGQRETAVRRRAGRKKPLPVNVQIKIWQKNKLKTKEQKS